MLKNINIEINNVKKTIFFCCTNKLERSTKKTFTKKHVYIDTKLLNYMHIIMQRSKFQKILILIELYTN